MYDMCRFVKKVVVGRPSMMIDEGFVMCVYIGTFVHLFACASGRVCDICDVYVMNVV